MNRIAITMAAAAMAVAGLTSNSMAVTNVTGFGSNGWHSGDTRSDTGTSLIGTNNTHPGYAPATALDDTAIAAQIGFGAAPTASTVGVNTGAGVIASHTWYNDSASASLTAALKIGFKTQPVVPGSSRPGEDVWDTLLIFEPSNGNTQPALNTWVTETITADSGKWWVVDRDLGFSGTAQSTPLTLNEMATSGVIYSGATTLADIYANMFGVGSVVTNVQFGMGSNNAGADVWVDQFYLAGLGDTIDFGATAGLGDALNLTVAPTVGGGTAANTAGKSTFSVIDRAGLFASSDLFPTPDVTTVVPEPMTASLGLLGLFGLSGAIGRRRRIA